MPIHFGRPDQAHCSCGSAARSLRASEQPALSPQCNRADHLWESANILRGPVDAADFKTYIFPLLFFKRICDVWDEEY